MVIGHGYGKLNRAARRHDAGTGYTPRRMGRAGPNGGCATLDARTEE
jgi:hypothetical protein